MPSPRKKFNQKFQGPRKKAIYLRKSRDESGGTEDVLAKHRRICVDICEKRGWEYVIYEEVGSSDSLEARPQMMRLMDDVEDGYYDGVVVVDYDRLSRGDEMDAAVIKRTFRKAGVKVYTPTRTYDLNDEMSDAMMSIEAVFARMEFLRIKRRLLRGKTEGAAMGKWVQGNLPYPYARDAATKQVVVDEEKRVHYLAMKEQMLAGVSPGDIAIWLNINNVISNNGKPWSAATVQNVLLNEFHMGVVAYGKSRGRSRQERIDRSEWVISEGTHERLKTPDEHARILASVASRRRLATKARAGTHPLSGLVKCAVCEKTHRATTLRGRDVLAACTRRSPTGEICPNAGVRASIVYEAITEACRQYVEELNDATRRATSREVGDDQRLESLRRELTTAEGRLSRLVDLYMDGKVSTEMYDEKRAPIEAEVRRLKAAIADLEVFVLVHVPVVTDEERRQLLGQVLVDNFWTRDDLTNKDRHSLMTRLFDRIELRAKLVDGMRRKVEEVVVKPIWR